MSDRRPRLTIHLRKELERLIRSAVDSTLAKKDDTNKLAMKTKPDKLAIIGTSGTGKTTLAAGLYASSTETFSVSVDGDEARTYLENLETTIESGYWPAATNAAANFDLQLHLDSLGRRTDIVFREYMGERMEKDPNYIEEIIGKPKSAMILFNPGMTGKTGARLSDEFGEVARRFADENVPDDDKMNAIEETVSRMAEAVRTLERAKFFDEVGAGIRDRIVGGISEVSGRLSSCANEGTAAPGFFNEMSVRLGAVVELAKQLPTLGLDEPDNRTRVIGNLKKISQHLKDNGCVAVAFVVTAADRLESDLSKFKVDFEAYASEVTNHLRNIGLNWERFDVTISGKLDNQNQPKIARGEDNNTRKPFQWLVEEVHAWERRKRLERTAAVAASAVAIVGAAAGGVAWFGHSCLVDAENEFSSKTNAVARAHSVRDEAAVRENAGFFTNDFGRIVALLPKDRARKNELLERMSEQDDLCKVRLLEIELSTQTNRLGTAPLDVPVDWFDRFSKSLDESSPRFPEAAGTLGALKSIWAEHRTDLERQCQTAHFIDDVAKISRTTRAANSESAIREQLKEGRSFLEATNSHNRLVADRNRLAVELFDSRTNAIDRFVESKARWNPTDEDPPEDVSALLAQVRRDLKSVLTDREFGMLDGFAERRRDAARKNWEATQFPNRYEKLRRDLRQNEAGSSVAFEESSAFLSSMNVLFPTVPEQDRLEAEVTLIRYRKEALKRYLDANTKWSVTDNDPPGDAEVTTFTDETKRLFTTSLTDDEFASLTNSFAVAHSTARKDWETCQFPARKKKQVEELKAAGESPAAALKDSLAFLDSAAELFSTVPENKLANGLDEIRRERAAAIGRYVDARTNWKPTDDNPPGDVTDLLRQARSDLKSALTEEESSDVEAKFAKRREDARKDWEKYQLPTRKNGWIRNLEKNDGSLASALRGSLGFLSTMTNLFATVPESDRLLARNEVSAARSSALDRYANGLTKALDVKGREEPSLDIGRIREVLTDGAVTPAEWNTFSNKVNAGLAAAKSKWRAEQKKIVDDFDFSVDSETLVRNYGEICDEWPNNPSLEDLCNKVDGALQEYFWKFISDYEELVFGSKQKTRVEFDQHPKQRMDEAFRSYNKFVRVCRALNGDVFKRNAILGKPSGKFAKLCCEIGGLSDTDRGFYSVFQQTLRITKIEACATIDKSAKSYLGLDLAVALVARRWHFETGSWETIDESTFFKMKTNTDSRKSGNLPKSRNDEWVTLWTGSKEFQVNPYTTTVVCGWFEDRLESHASSDVSDDFTWFWDWYPFLDNPTGEIIGPKRFQLDHTFHDSTIGTLRLRMTGKREGPDYRTIAREAGIIP